MLWASAHAYYHRENHRWGERAEKESPARFASAERVLRVPLSLGITPDMAYANQMGNQDPVSSRGPSTFLQFLKSPSHTAICLMIILSVSNPSLSFCVAKRCSYTRSLPRFLSCKTFSGDPMAPLGGTNRTSIHSRDVQQVAYQPSTNSALTAGKFASPRSPPTPSPHIHTIP